MFPWIYGFHWTPGYVIFLGVFFAVATIVVSTVVLALLRTLRDFRGKRAESIQWHGDFEELSGADRSCRHDFTGEMAGRKCELGFDCRHCVTHGKLVESQGGEQSMLEAGILNRFYHRGHTWVKIQPDGTALVGLDEIGRSLIGQPDRVELPARGVELQANGTAWKVWRNGRDFRVRAPIDGEVVEAGGEGHDWVLKMRPRQPLDTRHLLRGGEVHLWYRREMDRLQILASEISGMPALADGGQLVDDVAAELPAADWEKICGRMLLDQ